MHRIVNAATKSSGSQRNSPLASFGFSFMLVMLLAFTAFAPAQILASPLPRPLFQSPLPEPTQPARSSPAQPGRMSPSAGWIWSDEGGSASFGPVVVRVPPGFTDLEGAVVMGNMILDASTIRKPHVLIPGTEFGLLIITTDSQHTFQVPFELRITLDAGKVDPSMAHQLVVRMYNPATDRWEGLPSEFHASSYQMVARTATFWPAGPDMRTVFGVFVREGNPPLPGGSTPSPPRAEGPTVNRNANLRAGPGTNYAIVGHAVAGQALILDGRNAAGSWYRLASGEWIAAFLVDSAPALPVVPTTPTSLALTTTVTLTQTETLTPTQAPSETPTQTPTPRQMASPVATQEPPAQAPTILHAFGVLEIPVNQVADLDEGLLDSFSKADLWLDGDPAGGPWLVPRNGARLAVMGATPVGHAACVGAELSAERIALDDLMTVTGANVCLATNLGRPALFRIMRMTDGADGAILIACIVRQSE